MSYHPALIKKWNSPCQGLLALIVWLTGSSALAQTPAVPNLPPEALEVLRERPPEFKYDRFEFWAEQCLLLRNERDYEKTIETCERAIALKAGDRNTELWMARGQALFHLGRYPEALTSFNRVVQASRNYSAALAYQCAAWHQLQRYPEAVEICEQALKIDGNWGNSTPAFGWYYRGLALREMGRLETALGSFERALEIDANFDPAVAERCSLLSNLGLINPKDFPPTCTIQETVLHYEKALATYPNDVALLIQQGFALEQWSLEDANYERALTAYNRAIQLNPKHSVALARQCGILNQLQRYEPALASCNQALAGDQRWGSTGLPYALTQQSIALTGLGKFAEAIAAIDRTLELDVNYGAAWNSRAVTLWQRDPKDVAAQTTIAKAIAAYTTAEPLLQDTFQRNYPDPPVLFYRGQILALFNQGRILISTANSLKDYEASVAAYQQALAINNRLNSSNIKPIDNATISTIWTNLSAAYLRFNPDQAYAASQRAVSLDQNSFAGWFNQGIACQQLKNYACALDAFTQANRLRPSDLNPLIGQGITLENMGNEKEAIAVFNQILNRDPNQRGIQQRLERLMWGTPR